MREQVTRLSSYVLLRDSGRLLVCRLSIQTASPGMWTLPGGGVEFGESPEDAAIREVKEETGLTVTGLKLLEVWSQTEIFQDRDYHLIRFFYTATFTPQELVAEVGGSTDLCEWADASELSQMPVVSLITHVLPYLDRHN